ncbi:phospholipid/cholesterol/gamma-HCH transport system permease protein [Ekhidna lutea]|uniref:Phospholipid/cholesterol/gamma-HCH transport system permease protein n=2 Tax=Ekhidna lutea TaxID=447679 RepID=A0A239HC83_EKHLU|nr:phospholipid/cholesterol/gamma-HCH transport system permease protein [Ekhidna lutea]
MFDKANNLSVRNFMKSLGKFIIFIGQLFVRRESFKTYAVRTVDESIKVGYNSVFIVVIVSAFMGAVTTVQTAYNLISPLIADPIIALVVRDMTLLELAPTITAIVYAGKVGSNIAGELGTMKITEQVDALEVMGINATSYLVLPKIIGSVLMFPILVILAGFVSIYGGYLTALVTGVISGTDYILGIQMTFIPFAVTFALIKAVVFGFLVAAISSYKGYFTTGGALEVGQSSTNAVTSSCIAILAADYLLAYLLAPLLTP